LNSAGIELWALDEIGHGLTEGERAVIDSVDDLVENGRRLTALAEAAGPGAPVWLAGHSLGGAAAAVSAVRDPGRYAGLILSAAVLIAAWAELSDGFAQVPLPVLLIHGADDPVVPAGHARQWAGRLKHARLAEFAGARHDVLNETVHRAVAAVITEFIQTAAAGPHQPGARGPS
jgi:alpha-beta hydrolase superfamily lysophospholipase